MYYANSEISNHINTKHQILKDKSTSKRCIPDFIEKHSVQYRDTPHTMGFWLQNLDRLDPFATFT